MESDHIASVEFFTVYLLEKNSRFYHLPKPRYMQNIQCYNIMDIVEKKKKLLFLPIHYLYFKLHLMFKVNIPKDTATSGLSPYI
jgi:hypothetical protein